MNSLESDFFEVIDVDDLSDVYKHKGQIWPYKLIEAFGDSYCQAQTEFKKQFHETFSPPGILVWRSRPRAEYLHVMNKYRVRARAVVIPLSEPVASIYEGKPDTRLDAATEKPSRFRPRYRALTDDEIALHDAIKSKASELEELYEKIAPGRYTSLGITSLEESVMWAVKQLTGEGLKTNG